MPSIFRHGNSFSSVWAALVAQSMPKEVSNRPLELSGKVFFEAFQVLVVKVSWTPCLVMQ